MQTFRDKFSSKMHFGVWRGFERLIIFSSRNLDCSRHAIRDQDTENSTRRTDVHSPQRDRHTWRAIELPWKRRKKEKESSRKNAREGNNEQTTNNRRGWPRRLLVRRRKPTGSRHKTKNIKHREYKRRRISKIAGKFAYIKKKQYICRRKRVR